MSHLPDCDDYAFSGAGFHPNCERICICRQVRRVEARVRQEIDREAFTLDKGDPYREAYRAGLDAAREAVAAIRHAPDCRALCPCCMGDYDCNCERYEALAAIDALRGQPAERTGYKPPDAP